MVILIAVIVGVPLLVALIVNRAPLSRLWRWIIGVLAPAAFFGSLFFGLWHGYSGLVILLFSPLIISAWIVGFLVIPGVPRPHALKKARSHSL